jgi:hypothetical protein
MKSPQTAPSFTDYLKKFVKDWSALMSGSLSVPFMILALYVPGWSKPLVWILAAMCLIVASYLVFRTLYVELAARISLLEEEIRQLKIRPYDDAQRRLVMQKIGPLQADDRDLLRYLVQFGEREQTRIFDESGIDHNEFSKSFDRVAKSGLLVMEEKPKIGRAGIDNYWRINSNFVEVLRDQLFPRQEESPQRYFAELI